MSRSPPILCDDHGLGLIWLEPSYKAHGTSPIQQPLNFIIIRSDGYRRTCASMWHTLRGPESFIFTALIMMFLCGMFSSVGSQDGVPLGHWLVLQWRFLSLWWESMWVVRYLYMALKAKRSIFPISSPSIFKLNIFLRIFSQVCECPFIMPTFDLTFVFPSMFTSLHFIAISSFLFGKFFFLNSFGCVHFLISLMEPR